MMEEQQSKRPFPDFFLVGAPRCGTTAMSKYLSRNPQICFSKPKEPHFFSMLRREAPGLEIQADYIQQFFPHCSDSHRVWGEGSVSYLYYPAAIQAIQAENPAAKFIVMVRRPADLLYSYHARLLAVLEEDEKDFFTAWNLQQARAEGKRLPSHCHDPHLLQYTEVGMLGKWLEQLFDLAGRSHCLVIVHDDFVNDTRGAYLQVLEFLGVEDDGRTEFPRAESNKYIRFRWLQRLLKRPPRGLVSFVKTMEQQKKRKKRKKTRWMRIRKWLIKSNKVETERPAVDPRMAVLMKEAFAEDVRKLGQLLDRDLSHWV
jgi:hypothetical protein